LPSHRAQIDHIFQYEIGARANAEHDGWKVFELDRALNRAMAEIDALGNIDEEKSGASQATQLLLDWYAGNGGRITRGGLDRQAEPANADGTGLPLKLSDAESWLFGILKDFDPLISKSNAQTLVQKYKMSDAK